MNIRSSEIGVNLGNINTYHLVFEVYNLGYYLEKTPWSRTHIKYVHLGMDEIVLLLEFNQLECTTSSVSEFFCFCEIGILYDKLFGHDD